MQRRAIAFGLIAALAAASCKGKDERAANAQRVTADSTDDATEAILDEDYRFRIDWPGAGWKLLREKDVKRLLPDAVAGAMYKNTMFGAVVVESAPGVELEPFARLIADSMALEERNIELFEKTTFDGREAVRFIASGKVNGVQFRYADIVFLHDDHAYQVIGWGMANNIAADGSSFAPLFDAFHITEGEVTGRAEGAVVTEAHGVGWRVEKGIFESAVTGLRVEPNETWRITVGAELEQMSKDAEVGITRTGPETYAVFVVERAPAKAERKAYADSLAASLGATLGLATELEPQTVRFAGKEIELRRYRTQTAPIFEYLYAPIYEGDNLVQVIVWYLAAEQARVLPELQAGLDTVSFMPPERTRQLAEQLHAQRDPQTAVGATFSLRNGRYRDFARGWTWAKPDTGFWRMYAGDAARAVRQDLALYVTEPQLGLYGMVLDDSAAGFTPDSYHQAVVATMEGTKKARGKREVAGAQVRTSMIDLQTANGLLRYHLSTLVLGERAVQAIFWGQPGDVDASMALLDAAIGRFTFTDAPTQFTSMRGDEYRDERMGFAVKLPGDGWQLKDMTPAEVREAGSFVFWQAGNRMVGVVAVHALENADDTDWFLDFLEQIARDQFSQVANIAPKRAETTLAGVPARQLSWNTGVERLDAYLIVREKSIYALLMAGGNDGAGVLMDVLTGFRLLD